tara:strand:+ start:748 stop:1296 length:549 start_codon:yes stop_codon:yes gene_type:complete
MNLADDTKKRMEQAVEHLKSEYRSLRTNRVNPNMLDEVKVEVYGSEMTIKSLGTVSVQDRQLLVTPFDPSTSNMIAKAIQASQLNLNAVAEGGLIRVPVPPLNEDLRKDIAKMAKQKTEAAKVVVREIRRKSNELARKQKSDGEIAEDDLKREEKKIQELTDKHCKILDDLYGEKEKEILTI